MSIIEELEDLAENWERTAETYKSRLDKALRDNADLAAEKQEYRATITELEAKIELLETR